MSVLLTWSPGFEWVLAVWEESRMQANLSVNLTHFSQMQKLLARCECVSHVLPAAMRIHQPTPMRCMQMTPFWTVIIPSNEVIPTHEMTACHDVATVGIPFQVIDLTKISCLLATFSTLVWTKSTSCMWSNSWTVTRWAWAFFLYCLRVLWFRFLLASDSDCWVREEGSDCGVGGITACTIAANLTSRSFSRLRIVFDWSIVR